MEIAFEKMEGLGNDFIVIDNRDGSIDFSSDTIRFFCDRHFGIGADGVLTVEKGTRADLKMRIFNADGSEPEMCGNGIRCFALFAAEKNLVAGAEMTVETLAGIITPRLEGGRVAVDMGPPVLNGPDIPVKKDGEVINHRVNFSGREYAITCVSMGNPHCVIFLSGQEEPPVETAGPVIEKDDFFPRSTNVEFIRVISPEEIRCDVWERGAGRTLACGTGACAAVVAGVLTGRTSRDVLVHLPGGDLEVGWEGDGPVMMTGPARFVFSGQIKI